MKKYILFSLLFSLACFVWQCGNSNGNGGDPVQPAQPDTSPTITSFSPTSAGVGATVTITGTNFSGNAPNNIVKFNGKTANVTSVTTTSISAVVPSGATTGKITVEVAGKTATSASDFTFIPYTIVSTLAGGASGTGSIDGTGANARFSIPFGIVKDSQGNFFISDNSSHVIRKMTPAGVVTTFVGTSGLAGNANGTGASARFRSPTGLCIDASDNLYVAESSGYRIRKITPAGVVSNFVGSVSAVAGNVDGTGDAARFDIISGITIDAQGNIYVADTNNNKIRKVTPAGVVTTLASNVNASTIHITPQGNLYIADPFTVRSMNVSTGAVTFIAGTANNTGFADGTGASVKFNSVRGMGSDSEGNIYITDGNNRRIRKLIPSTGVVTTFSGTGTLGNANGAVATANYDWPTGIYVDNANKIMYITDASYGTIRKIE
jgi:sugar lactone lactonase YvrE